MNMAQAGIQILCCLILSCLASEAAEELSPWIVYDLLSRRFDNIVQETNSLKSELEETKSIVNRIENKIENIEASVSDIVTDSKKRADEMSESVINENCREISESVIKYEIMRQMIIVNKMLSKEKQLLRKGVQSFEDKFTTFESSIKSEMEVNLNHMFSTFRTDISKINTDLQNSKTGINKRLENAKSGLSYMSSKLYSLERNQTDMSSKLYSLERKQEGKENFDDQISRLSSRISEEETRKVAFSAKLSEKRSYAADEKIVFDRVVYSYGGGYNPSTGIFTAPKSGTYLFTFNLRSKAKKIAHVFLMVRGSYKTSAVVEGDGLNLTGGNVGIEFLSYGDTVWIETGNSREEYFISAYETTFNGILID